MKLNKEKTVLEKKLKTVSKDFFNYKNNIKYLKQYNSIRNKEEKLEKLIKRMEYVLDKTNKEISKREKESDDLAIEIYTKQKFLQN
ncbi:hypothetical protein ABW636_18920 [Aquimarina sp. 2201CG1-2-11]|uniref:hypothetical protein n=1 Tax=Aquimarina discodermiae TaxID=3231043 RepID=UPI003462BA0A